MSWALGQHDASFVNLINSTKAKKKPNALSCSTRVLNMHGLTCGMVGLQSQDEVELTPSDVMCVPG